MGDGQNNQYLYIYMKGDDLKQQSAKRDYHGMDQIIVFGQIPKGKFIFI